MKTVLIAGTGDRASATAVRLFQSGFTVILLDYCKPLNMYIHRNFTQAVYNGYSLLMNVPARTLPHAVESGIVEDTISVEAYMRYASANREIPVITEEEAGAVSAAEIDYLVRVDESLSEYLPDQGVAEARVIGFDDQEGEGDYTVAVHEPLRGQVCYPFNRDYFEKIEPMAERKYHRVHLPIEGIFVALKKINDPVVEKEPLARINDIPVLAPESGRLVGMLNSGIIVPAGTDFAEIAPAHAAVRGDVIPSSEWAIAGAVLEAILYDINLEQAK
jgi:hypothetical protein